MAKQITISLADQTVTAIEALSTDLEGFVREAVEQELVRLTQLAPCGTLRGYGVTALTSRTPPEEIVEFVRHMRVDAERPQP